MRPALLLSLIACCLGCASRAAAQDQALLPPDGFRQAWKKAERARVFTSADLYGYIDGGAEIFLEFGFEQLTVQLYTSNFGKSGPQASPEELQIEVYRMKDPVAATGMYLMNCGKETPDAAFAERHTLNEFQLLFKKNRYYVIINNVNGSKAVRPAVVEFARFIASRLPPEQPLKVDELLPRAGLEKSSVRLIRGPYALQAIFTLGEGDILQLGRQITAVSGNYQDAAGKRTLIQVDYPDEKAAQRAFQFVRKNLDSYLKAEESSESRLVFKDTAGQFGAVSIRGIRLSVQLHLAKRPAKAR